MDHHSKSSHAHILMSGHNPEHQKHQHTGHRGTSNVHHRMKHAHSHPNHDPMHRSNMNHNSHDGHHKMSQVKPCDILMREHHFSGGISGGAPHFAEGGHVEHESHGGRMHRRHRADGGDTANKYDSMVGYENPEQSPEGRTYRKGGHCRYAEGGETKRDYGEKPLTGQLRRGGRAKRHCHYEGEAVADNSVREEKRRGGRTKRQHHYWGQDFFGRIPLIGGIANSIANTVGTLDPHQYGGSEYVATTPGQKAADIFSTIGNLGSNVLLSRGSSAPKKRKGGMVHHKHRYHHAAGGAGKVRKGMMTEAGQMIHSNI